VSGLDRNARLALDVELATYRIIQEALTNVARHAGASSVSVVVRVEPTAVVVVIEDDGRGFDPKVAEKDASHLGLRDMQERVEAVGGTLTLETVPTQGTTVRATLPLTPPGPS
jgi:signal transduction histidine kinase